MYKSLLSLQPHSGIIPPDNPSSTEPPNPDIAIGCVSGPVVVNSIGCIANALATIDNARAIEDVPPLSFDIAAFEAMAPPEQLFAIANLERVDRGLQPFKFQTAQLNQFAQTGADDSDDPVPTTALPGGAQISDWGSNWDGGSVNVLAADDEWMYDDGFGSSNEDCTYAGAPGCWGHRDNILMANASSGCYSAMGAATASLASGQSYAEIFVNACGSPPIDEVYSWSAVETVLEGDGQFEISTQELVSPSDFASSYSDWLEVEDGVTPYSWSITSGAIPPGYALSSAGQLTGPASVEPGTYSFTTSVQEATIPAESVSKPFTLIVTGPPDPPTNVSATVAFDQTTVSWSAPLNDGGSPIRAYIVTSNPGDVICVATTTMCIVSALTNGVSYTFTVIALNATDKSAPSLPSNSVSQGGPTNASSKVPSALRIRVLSPSRGEIEIQIVGRINDGGQTITEFQYSLNSESWKKAIQRTNGTFIVRHLVPGKRYRVRLRAINGIGAGLSSPTVVSKAK
jgi:hypothetical protein